MRLAKLLTLLILIPFVMNAQTFEKDVFKSKKRNGKDITITFIEHASLMLEYAGQVIYIDPVKEYNYCYKMPDADMIIITHQHSDHFNVSAIKALLKPSTKIVANKEVVDSLNKGLIMSYGDDVSLSPSVQVKAVAAYNTTKEHKQFHPKGMGNGYILTIDGTKIYIAGDTEYISEMKNLKNKIDIAFLPVNQPYTMTVEQAVKAVKAINPKIFYPYHYGQVDEITDIKALEAELENTDIEVRIRQLQ
ncbi:MAG: MBL fold metallo-hydrolase [Bacteroidales bacterium]|jgi:L-ascorbate metabolism protein UlaG (beta-lactamase superfamily)|nr:MBL fold metallo-hydrolase [Bacteroidales bacterium]